MSESPLLRLDCLHRGIEPRLGGRPKKKDPMPHVATSSLLDDSKEGPRRGITTYAERSEESPAAGRAVPNVRVVVLVVEQSLDNVTFCSSFKAFGNS